MPEVPDKNAAQENRMEAVREMRMRNHGIAIEGTASRAASDNAGCAAGINISSETDACGVDVTPINDPDFYSNTGWMISEIVLAHQILARKIKDLRAANDAKAGVNQKLAAEEVSRLAEQLKACADIIVRKTAEHLNRRAVP